MSVAVAKAGVKTGGKTAGSKTAGSKTAGSKAAGSKTAGSKTAGSKTAVKATAPDKKAPPKFKQRNNREFKSQPPKRGVIGFGEDIPGMEGLGTAFTVICPWEAYSHLELHELSQYGII